MLYINFALAVVEIPENRYLGLSLIATKMKKVEFANSMPVRLSE